MFISSILVTSLLSFSSFCYMQAFSVSYSIKTELLSKKDDFADD